MTDRPHPISCGFAASVPGAGHIRYATPCQDASGVILAPRPAAIVCDGRGSAKLSHFGAQGAVRAFFSQLSVLEPFLAGALDREAPAEKWDGICRLFYRTLLQVKLDFAAERGGEEKDFDFTVAFAVAGSVSIGCFQVGDGAIVLRNGGVCRTAFEPDKGEFANQTQFLRPGGDAAGKFHARLFPAAGNEGVAITSDGPEHLMFRQPAMEPGPIFGQLLDDLAAGELCEQDLRDYLTRPVWSSDPRGSDDRSIAVLLPNAVQSAVHPVKAEPPDRRRPEPPPVPIGNEGYGEPEGGTIGNETDGESKPEPIARNGEVRDAEKTHRRMPPLQHAAPVHLPLDCRHHPRDMHPGRRGHDPLLAEAVPRTERRRDHLQSIRLSSRHSNGGSMSLILSNHSSGNLEEPSLI